MSVIERGAWPMTVRVCPDCANQRHTYPCPHCGSGLSGEVVEVVPADQLAGAVGAFAQERQAVLDIVNLYGDETLHKALDSIGWPADYVSGK